MKRTNIFLPSDMLKKVTRIAEKEAMTKAQVIRSALVGFIREWEAKHEPVVLKDDESGSEPPAG